MNKEENKKFEEAGRILSGEQPAVPNGVDQELSAVWNAAGKYTYASASENDQAWAQLKGRLNQQPPMKVTWLRRNRMAVAASLALFLFAGGGIWFVSQKQDAEIAAIYVKTGSNERKSIQLADGSSITLNSNSEITVKQGFNQGNRDIILTGQASFEVARNEELPFEVQAGPTKTKVLGTGFDILAYPGESVRILVKHGKVNFGNKGQQLTLVKGEGGLYNPQTGKLALYTGDTASNHWQSGEWVFKKTKLEDIALMFKHRYGKALTYNSKDADRLFTGKFHANASAEDIAGTLREALQIDLKIE